MTHPAVAEKLEFFEFEHLPAELRAVSEPCARLAHLMATSLPQSSQVTLGLQKLLEAKDCFVRAALPKREGEAG
ncbi:hypothetical protein ACFORH_43005 [Amycolatopsis roodepoortensis]|uniref:3-methyladenine DNA glycosylase AlkC n=1 Tax=Amycolatopsis roodepoortensis TaxID=700274 RepID=A0ABR9L2R6_9PSEU|nr:MULTISPECIES: hypothetical protein [Amycolatopsis]MBE1575058.1 3-methyladenine DNA glycosylase AlkC [Amycolatopsis roodepoortensis]